VGSTAALNVKTTGADTETPVAPFCGLLVTVVCAQTDDRPASSSSAETPKTRANEYFEFQFRFDFMSSLSYRSNWSIYID
jgi:hypothetical protein